MPLHVPSHSRGWQHQAGVQGSHHACPAGQGTEPFPEESGPDLDSQVMKPFPLAERLAGPGKATGLFSRPLPTGCDSVHCGLETVRITS